MVYLILRFKNELCRSLLDLKLAFYQKFIILESYLKLNLKFLSKKTFVLISCDPITNVKDIDVLQSEKLMISNQVYFYKTYSLVYAAGTLSTEDQ